MDPALLRGKKVVCVISGSNNDIDRMQVRAQGVPPRPQCSASEQPESPSQCARHARVQEIKERSLIYEGLKHYLLVRFAQRPGGLPA